MQHAAASNALQRVRARPVELADLSFVDTRTARRDCKKRSATVDE
jgi:hypothetical protein